ncbi:calcium-binding protein [Methylobacterium iners]|uniref:calcium-binding protein n=1 Tax=Methylobacterium iners TaxID=418707 RepID=UPI0027961D5B|nr:calcium-binding protein [Methylobacterium iners]
MATKRNDRLVTDFRADDNDPANGASGSVIIGTPNGETLDGGNGKDRIEARAGNDLLRGGNGKDELYGELGNDELNGGNGKDLLDGGPGDDILAGENGNDLLIGGSGIDRAVFDFSFAQARFDYSGGGLAVSGPSSGTDQLIGIERIQFSDAPSTPWTTIRSSTTSSISRPTPTWPPRVGMRTPIMPSSASEKGATPTPSSPPPATSPPTPTCALLVGTR